MKAKIGKYRQILKIELEDLEKDLLIMAEIYHQREQKKEITDYVFLENLSLLQSEIAGIDNIIESLEEIDISKFNTVEEFVSYITEEFRKETKEDGFPESVFALVSRKLNKVTRYLLSSEE
jgi:hypothetical protein